jgi:hypothetical protein
MNDQEQKFNLPRVTTIHRKMWVHIVTMITLPIVLLLPLTIAFALTDDFLRHPTDVRWIFPILFVLMLLWISLILANTLFRYRLEVDSHGLRICGVITSKSFNWEEIESIKAYPNYRLPGYHAAIVIDKSKRPRRDWRNFWQRTYHCMPGMMKNGRELTRYLNKRRSMALRLLDQE